MRLGSRNIAEISWRLSKRMPPACQVGCRSEQIQILQRYGDVGLPRYLENWSARLGTSWVSGELERETEIEPATSSLGKRLLD